LDNQLYLDPDSEYYYQVNFLLVCENLMSTYNSNLNTNSINLVAQVQMQLHIWEKSHCYFVVWTECDCAEVIVQKDASFRGVMELLEDYLFTSFYPYILSEARADRLQQFKAAQKERRLKKLRRVEGGGHKGIQFFQPVISNVKKVSSKRANSK
jgi:hypothetical protein